MFTLTSSHQYYLYNGRTDMRKSFDGLCGLVRSKLHRDPMSGEVFVFINRRCNQIKLLNWEQGGFILYYKRLEAGTFELSSFDTSQSCCHIQWSELVMMTEGISMKNLHYRKRFSLKESG
ncbi:MAG: IS66 family insertion sequence element accessory protein TnpB [Bacteroidota bacterium]|nr:IS66 family insertion sequence element accessory protein TnpB [Bacteroidota bacterium]